MAHPDNLKVGRYEATYCIIFSIAWLIAQQWHVYRQKVQLVADVPKGFSSLAGADLSSYWGLASYFIVLFFLHLLYALINYSSFSSLASPRLLRRERWLALTAQLLLVTLALHLLTSWIFPFSVIGSTGVLLLARPSGMIVFIAISAVVAFYFSVWLFMRPQRKWTLMLAALAGIWLVISYAPVNSVERDRPDVVIFAFDSLRPDHLQSFGAPFNVMPVLDSRIKSGVAYRDVLSPQPHTFPATMSMLLGEWPVTSGVRGNLFPIDGVSVERTLGDVFRDEGYVTVYATDESRFSNIDESYGFDRVLSPGFGVSEMSMSFVADGVLSNLFSILPISNWILPQVYGNHALWHIYRPDSFVGRVKSGLSGIDQGKPIFLYVHLCAAHWPYVPESPYSKDELSSILEGDFSDSSADYIRGLSIADDQFSKIESALDSLGRSRNFLHVYVSDHGEDFNMRKDGLNKEGGMAGKLNGHGGSAVRAPQVSVFMAFRGAKVLATEFVDTPASLVDLAPSVMGLAGVADKKRRDGVDLFLPQGDGANDRCRFVESSFFPVSMDKRVIDERAVIREMSQMYELRRDGAIQLKKSWIPYQVDNRQRAVYCDGWILSAYGGSGRGFIVSERNGAGWWSYGEQPDEVPVDFMRRSFCEHWSEDAAAQKICL